MAKVVLELAKEEQRLAHRKREIERCEGLDDAASPQFFVPPTAAAHVTTAKLYVRTSAGWSLQTVPTAPSSRTGPAQKGPTQEEREFCKRSESESEADSLVRPGGEVAELGRQHY